MTSSDPTERQTVLSALTQWRLVIPQKGRLFYQHWRSDVQWSHRKADCSINIDAMASSDPTERQTVLSALTQWRPVIQQKGRLFYQHWRNGVQWSHRKADCSISIDAVTSSDPTERQTGLSALTQWRLVIPQKGRLVYQHWRNGVQWSHRKADCSISIGAMASSDPTERQTVLSALMQLRLVIPQKGRLFYQHWRNGVQWSHRKADCSISIDAMASSDPTERQTVISALTQWRPVIPQKGRLFYQHWRNGVQWSHRKADCSINIDAMTSSDPTERQTVLSALTQWRPVIPQKGRLFYQHWRNGVQWSHRKGDCSISIDAMASSDPTERQTVLSALKQWRPVIQQKGRLFYQHWRSYV